jgi:hypothetical protein
MASKETDNTNPNRGAKPGAAPQSAVPRSASTKAVDRAAKAGGGRTRAQSSKSWGYIGTLIGISVVGTALIGTSFWSQREDPKAPYRQTEERSKAEFKLVSDARKKYKDNPKSAALKKAESRYQDYLTNSHIHSAYGFYDCTQSKGSEWLPPIDGTGDPDTTGIHSHEDGLLHTHPFVKSVTGRRAVLGRWMDTVGIKASDSRIVVPAKGPTPEAPDVKVQKEIALKAGVKCKNNKPAVLQIFEYKDAVIKGATNKDAKAKRVLGDAKDIPLKANWAYAFVLADKDFVPGLPPSVKSLEAPSDAVAAGDAVDPGAVPVAPEPATGSTVVGSTVAGSTVVGAPTSAGAATTAVEPAETKPAETVAPTTKK